MARQRQPVYPDAPPVLRELVTDLRALVDREFVSLRELERAAHVGRSTVSDALSGHRLPSQGVLAAIVRACGAEEDAWQERWRSTRVALLEAGDTPRAEDQPGTEDQPATEDWSVTGPPRRPAVDGGHATLFLPPPEPVFAPLAEADPRKVGSFRLRGVVGSGAMGRVYLADPDAAQPWLATAYVAGPSLRQVVSEYGPLPAACVRRLAAGVAEALAGMHAVGIVHRDLNPGNVLLAAEGPVVIDFGIAHAMDASHLTRTGAHLGTAAFMAPEQATAGPVGPATDVYALGALASFAVTGVPPFGDGPAEAVLYRVVHESPDLHGVDDPVLRELIAGCLSGDPDARPTPEQVVARLDPDPTPTLLDAAADAPAPAWLPAPVAASLPRYDPAHAPRGRIRGRRAAGGPGRATPRTRRRVAFTAAGVAVAMLLGTGALLEFTGPHNQPASAAGGAGQHLVNRSSAPSSPSSSSAATPAGSVAGSVVAASPAGPSGAASNQMPGAGSVPVVLVGQGTDTGHANTGHSGAGNSSGSAGGAASGGGGGGVAPRVSVPLARMNFEDGGNDSWGPFWGGDNMTQTVTTQVAYDGTHSLRITAGAECHDDGCAIGTDAVSGLHAGSPVTLHVRLDGPGQGTVQPFVQDTNFTQHWAQGTTTLDNGWSTVTFTVPDVSVKGIGIQIDATGGQAVTIALDAVNW